MGRESIKFMSPLLVVVWFGAVLVVFAVVVFAVVVLAGVVLFSVVVLAVVVIFSVVVWFFSFVIFVWELQLII